MINFHAVMIDETGCEFGASVSAPTREEARESLREDYPESQIWRIEDPTDTAARLAELYRSAYDEDDAPAEDECDQCGAEIVPGELCEDCEVEIDYE